MYATPLSHALPPRPTFEIPYAHATTSTAPYKEEYDLNVHCAFAIQFAVLAGPDREDIIHATSGHEKWLEPPSVSPGRPVYPPAYDAIYNGLKEQCEKWMKVTHGPDHESCKAKVIVNPHRGDVFGNTKGTNRTFVVGVILSGRYTSMVLHLRGILLQSCPVALKTACVDIEKHQHSHRICQQLDEIAMYTGTDIFVLKPREEDDIAGNPDLDASQQSRFKIKIYGDYESVEHAKFRVLIMIDKLMGAQITSTAVECSLQASMAGRGRKNIKLVESTTNTAIYFPPLFPTVYGYTPQNIKCQRRDPEQVFVVGKMNNINKARFMLDTMKTHNQPFVKTANVQAQKIDFMLIERLEEILKIAETNGTYIQLPKLGSAQNGLRVQGSEMLHIERTVRSINTIAGQYYQASWKVAAPGPSQRELDQTFAELTGICGVDVLYTALNFDIIGSDVAVKSALGLLNEKSYLKHKLERMTIRIELAVEHKEFVSGKKNGKINKIMSQSHINILFDCFNDYNFHIEVRGSEYNTTMSGLEMVEQELPAAISFHVPDGYHKRIIGVGGTHIQGIMKKYSVFVKFSNAQDRGGPNPHQRADHEDLQVDNVICRTPARNASNLDLVKADIMDMVQMCDKEVITETVTIPRLYHRSLIAHRELLEQVEQRWGCVVSFPSTEMASDIVTIKGPEWQMPHFKDSFLALVPETHHIKMTWNRDMEMLCTEPQFQTNVIDAIKTQFSMDVEMLGDPSDETAELKTITFSYTRNHAGSLGDAIELLRNYFITHGQHAELIKGRLSRPKSDSFEDFAPYFNSAVHPKTSSQESLYRPESRLSADSTSAAVERHSSMEPPMEGETREAFYNADRRRSSVPSVDLRPPGSSGSASSNHTPHYNHHSRQASMDLESDWDRTSNRSVPGGRPV